MAQNIVNYANNPTGPELLDDYLSKEQENNLSSNSGIQRPSYAVAGTLWIDTSVTPWLYKLYDGTSDITIGAFNPSTHLYTATGVDESNLVHKTENETITGGKTFSSSPQVPDGVNSTDAVNKGQLNTVDNNAVHKTGNETVAGNKTFTGSVTLGTATATTLTTTTMTVSTTLNIPGGSIWIA
jgi:hypothetical protein